jgi:hypothetical protein
LDCFFFLLFEFVCSSSACVTGRTPFWNVDSCGKSVQAARLNSCWNRADRHMEERVPWVRRPHHNSSSHWTHARYDLHLQSQQLHYASLPVSYDLIPFFTDFETMDLLMLSLGSFRILFSEKKIVGSSCWWVDKDITGAVSAAHAIQLVKIRIIKTKSGMIRCHVHHLSERTLYLFFFLTTQIYSVSKPPH